MKTKTLAIDFDGVIHEYREGWKDGMPYGLPVDNAKEQLAKIIDSGYTIVIHSTRLSMEPAVQRGRMIEWLNKHGFEQGTHYHDLTGMKPKAIAYIDDRGVRFTNWLDVSKMFC